MSKPRRSRTGWRKRQERDPYVQRARNEGWRSRAVYKLEQIERSEHMLRPDIVCVDLGAAPGSWSQYVAARSGGRAIILAVDLLPMDPLPGVDFIQGDFTDTGIVDELGERLGEARADLVISDMAPNISGNRVVDQPRAMNLAELALDCCRDVLKPRGDFVCKLFQGQGFEGFVAEAKTAFERVKVIKPAASRPGSREVYLVARNYQL